MYFPRISAVAGQSKIKQVGNRFKPKGALLLKSIGISQKYIIRELI